MPAEKSASSEADCGDSGDLNDAELPLAAAGQDAARCKLRDKAEEGRCFRNKRRRRAKIRQWIARMLSWLKKGSNEVPLECCTRWIGAIRTVDGDDKRMGQALTLFDTGSRYNYVSMPWLKKKGVNLSSIEPLPEGSCNQVNGQGGRGNTILGEMVLTWAGDDEPRKKQMIYLKPKSFTDRFFVVESNEYDLIIGLDAIREYNLLTKEHWIFANKTQGGKIPIQKPLSAEEREALKKMKEGNKALQDKVKSEMLKKASG